MRTYASSRVKRKSFYRKSELQMFLLISGDHIHRAKKVVFDGPGLVDFAVGRVNSILNLNSNYRRTVINLAHQKIFSGRLK